jgi:hypothetical protein
LIGVLVTLCADTDKKLRKEGMINDTDLIKANLILLEFLEKENFYREKLLYLTNRGDTYRLDKCLETANVILSKKTS